jgi:hypothetical protein
LDLSLERVGLSKKSLSRKEQKNTNQMLFCKNYSKENQATFYINTEPEKEMQQFVTKLENCVIYGVFVRMKQKSEVESGNAPDREVQEIFSLALSISPGRSIKYCPSWHNRGRGQRVGTMSLKSQPPKGFI